MTAQLWAWRAARNSSAGCCSPDEPRARRAAAIDDLRELGLRRQVLLTGDRPAVARRIADFLGLPNVRAQALPAQKMTYVLDGDRRRLPPHGGGRRRINDSLALKVGAVGHRDGGRAAPMCGARGPPTSS